MTTDFYKTLGVKKTATKEEISKAYREMARKYHPDLHPDDKAAKQKFQDVQEAFDTLNDPEKRKMYDQFGADYSKMGGGAGPGGGGGFRGAWPGGGPAGGGAHGPGAQGGNWQQEFRFEDLGDMFRQPGAGRQAGGAGGGVGFDPSDIFGMFGQQFRGGGGGGAEAAGAGRSRRRAAAEKGADIQHEITITFQESILGTERDVAIHDPAGGMKKITAKIPAGMEDDKKIRLRGLGETSPTGGPPGDLVLRVHVTPHKHFSRQGNNLLLRLPVKLSEAVLGAKVTVPTPKKTVEVSIPPGTSSGKKLRVKGLGVPGKGGVSGDLLVEIMIQLPPHVTDSQKDAVRGMDAAYAADPRAGIVW